MWKINKIVGQQLVTLQLSGRFEGKHLTQLQEITAREAADQHLVLDLKDVKLVDRDAVIFLAGCEMHGAELHNCPIYIRDWINRERMEEDANRVNSEEV